MELRRRHIGAAAALIPLALAGRALAGGAQLEQVRSLAPTALVRVEVDWLDVRVEASSGPGMVLEVHMQSEGPGSGAAAGRQLKASRPRILQDDTFTLIQQRRERPTGLRPGERAGELRLQVPAGVELEIDTLGGTVHVGSLPAPARVTLVSTTGDLTIGREARLDAVELSTPAGDITFLGEAARLTANTTRGAITLSPARPPARCALNTASGDVHITGGCAALKVGSTSGRIDGQALTGDVEILTVEGPMSLAWARLGEGDRAELHSLSGAIGIWLPGVCDPGGSLETLGSAISSDLDLIPDASLPTRVRLPGSAGRLDVYSAAGAITVTQAGSPGQLPTAAAPTSGPPAGSGYGAGSSAAP